MKIFLSSLEQNTSLWEDSWLNNLSKYPFKLKWNLVSYYYAKKGLKLKRAILIRDSSDKILVDSGAHSLQKGRSRPNWRKYVDDYAKFISEFDRPNVLGFFELDIDAIIGFESVINFRQILRQVSDKIIPVWHKNRGIDNFKLMCEEHSGGIVAISGFRNEDICDDQYLMFLKCAKKHNCKLHCLGMARKDILDKVPFDYTDSSSWGQGTVFAYTFLHDGKKYKLRSEWVSDRANREALSLRNYLYGVRMQEYYYEKWRAYDEDSGGIAWRQLLGE